MCVKNSRIIKEIRDITEFINVQKYKECFSDFEKLKRCGQEQDEVEGYFESNFDQQEDKISQYGKNAVAILFPYVRALVSSFTSNANVTPLILPTVNVNRLLEQE